MSSSASFSLNCPIPLTDYPHVLMAHGGGGRLMNSLIEKLFVTAFQNAPLEKRHDGAVLETDCRRIAFSTDSYVVRPLFFPGGDIGTLAVNGTVNDLAMCGARAKWLSAGFIIEEGLRIETLWNIVLSMARTAQEAGVQIVTGDTKVVDKGKGDGLFINTAGVGVVEHDSDIGPANVRPGDAVLLSGDIGRHGMAIMSVREGLAFEGGIESDCACVSSPVMAMIEAGVEIHCMRDLTRGGLAAALYEIAGTSKLQIQIEEEPIPVIETVRGACEILGLDPLYVANEGRFIVIVPSASTARALEILRAHPVSAGATLLGRVDSGNAGLVTMRSKLGSTRIIDLLSGEQLPRIC
jgi:hydrogenase expression/formation protein HypE